EASLKGDMGFFGRAHEDNGDSPGGFSHMICNSDLPAHYTPGFFFILQLGVFVVLDCYMLVNFNGHCRHGGTPSINPTSQPLVKWAYRFIVIAYPPSRMVNGTARILLAALPNNKAFILPPKAVNTG
ncbi:hypothetical protein C8J57DRAFT_1093149, partial [Mycena rebaudengoi]